MVAAKKAKLTSALSVSKRTHSLERLVLLKDIKLTSYEDTAQVKHAWRIDAGAIGLILQGDSAATKRTWIKLLLDAKNSLLGRHQSMSAAASPKRQTAQQMQAEESVVTEEDVKAHDFTKRFASIALDRDVTQRLQETLWDLQTAIARGQFERAEDLLERADQDLAALVPTDSLESSSLHAQLQRSRHDMREKLVRMFGVDDMSVEELATARPIVAALGALEAAQDAFLGMRARYAWSLTQRLSLWPDSTDEGGVGQFLRDYVFLQGTMLKETGQMYGRIFDPDSSFLFWLRLQMKQLAGTVSRLLLTPTSLIDSSLKAEERQVLTQATAIKQCLRECCEVLAVSTEGIGLDCLHEFEGALRPLMDAFLHALRSTYMARLGVMLEGQDPVCYEQFDQQVQALRMLVE